MRRLLEPFLLLLALAVRPARAGDLKDAYLAYLESAPEFRRVRQDREFLLGRWDTWVYMPWRYEWEIGTGDEAGEFCREHGINGGFLDYGKGPLAWLEKHGLRFYNDHTAGKGFLHLAGANNRENFRRFQRDPRAVRSGTDGPCPLDDALRKKLERLVWNHVHPIRKSPFRLAYALDDEPSWGAFLIPLPWRVNEDDAAYEAWLRCYYGGSPPPPRWITPEDTRAQLRKRLREIDLSPLLDRMTYNDSVWAEFLGALVEACNAADPETPAGIVGAQAPSLWGGYDYAKLSKKLQFVEAYDDGSAQEILRSFNPENAMPVVTTHFHDAAAGVERDTRLAWYYFAHGNRGMIGWVEGWFEGGKPRPWLRGFAPTLRELGGAQGPKLAGARFVHDRIAIYYSHASIQVSWCLDAEAHGSTWPNRGEDARLGTSHLVRKAWEYMLADEGLQYDFVAYDEVARNGVPEAYDVLILPACFALSDLEAARIREFAARGGLLIADFGCGLFDHHGRGRTRGALDDLFGVSHDGTERKADFFGGTLWVETDQDKAYGYRRFRELFETSGARLHEGFAVAERRLPAGAREGRARYLNLSPQRYLLYREEGAATAAHRRLFLGDLGARRRLRIVDPAAPAPHYEATFWRKGDRTYVFIFQNPLGAPLKGRREITLEFASPVSDLLDERAGTSLGAGRAFSLSLDLSEAALLSFK